MSDEEKFLEDDVTGEAEEEASKKSGFLPGILITVLKWTAIGIGVIALVMTIAWGTFKLFIEQGRSGSGAEPGRSLEQKKIDIPLEYFSTNLDNVRGQTADIPAKSFVASIQVGYRKGKTTVQTELIEKKERIRNMILKYLSQKPAEALAARYYDKIEEELTKNIDNLVRSGTIESVLINELLVY